LIQLFLCSFPCSSLAIFKEYIIGGYGTGHIRIFNLVTGKIIAEVCAHAQWINAIDVAEKSGLVRMTCNIKSLYFLYSYLVL
jgi:hypothetical protein